MSFYFLTKHLHITLALISGVYFAARGIWRIGLGREIRGRLWKTLPHVIDTLLLASGVALAVMLSLPPHRVGWFGLKLVLVVVYILLGISAFRGRRKGTAWLCYFCALAVWLWIIGIALNKHPGGWLA